jgi:hypothetical protein
VVWEIHREPLLVLGVHATTPDSRHELRAGSRWAKDVHDPVGSSELDAKLAVDLVKCPVPLLLRGCDMIGVVGEGSEHEPSRDAGVVEPGQMRETGQLVVGVQPGTRVARGA